MTNNDSPNFDPRFDPAFQRGFQGDQQQTGGQRDASARAAQVPQQSAQPMSAPAQPTNGASPAIDGRTPDVLPASAVARADFQLDDEEAVPAGFLRRRPSGLLVVLLAIAAGLLAASIWLYAMLRDAFSEPVALSSPSDYYVMQSLQFLAPMLATLGLATAIGVIFVFAIRAPR